MRPALLYDTGISYTGSLWYGCGDLFDSKRQEGNLGIPCDSDTETYAKANTTRAVLEGNSGWSIQYTFIVNRGVEAWKVSPPNRTVETGITVFISPHLRSHGQLLFGEQPVSKHI